MPSTELLISSNIFCQKSIFACKYRFLRILIHTEKRRETIIDVPYFIDDWYSLKDRGTLRSEICTADSSENCNSVFNKEIEKNICVCAV